MYVCVRACMSRRAQCPCLMVWPSNSQHDTPNKHLASVCARHIAHTTQPGNPANRAHTQVRAHTRTPLTAHDLERGRLQLSNDERMDAARPGGLRNNLDDGEHSDDIDERIFYDHWICTTLLFTYNVMIISSYNNIV